MGRLWGGGERGGEGKVRRMWLGTHCIIRPSFIREKFVGAFPHFVTVSPSILNWSNPG